MNESVKLTAEDIRLMKTDVGESIRLIKSYAARYEGQAHYEHLGSSCVMAATGAVNSVIGSAEYMDGTFLMPDEIHVERLVDWFLRSKDFECDRDVLTFYFAEYIKRKINYLYRCINRGECATTFVIMGDETARKEFEKQWRKRRKQGVKLIRGS